MTALERFLRYVSYDTQSSETSQDTPSTPKQRLLGAEQARELQALGLEGAHLAENGAVYAWLPASRGRRGVPVLALLAHLDTAPGCPANTSRPGWSATRAGTWCSTRSRASPCPRRTSPTWPIRWGGSWWSPTAPPSWGPTTRPGWRRFSPPWRPSSPTRSSPHGRVAVCITPDEEVGRGAGYVDLDKLGAAFGYTVDGGPLGELEYENFNAAEAEVLFHGVNIHPGEGKNKLRNASLMAAQFIAMVPPAEAPAHTEGYEGFYHLCTMEGDESLARLQWLIRDHDWDSFQRRKRTLEGIAFYLETRYGLGTVEVKLTDSYYNMREKVLPHPSCWTGPGKPSAGQGWNPGTSPSGGHRRGPAELAGPALPQPLHRGVSLPRGL